MENNDETENIEKQTENLKARLATANQDLSAVTAGIDSAKQTVESFVLENSEETEKIKLQKGEVRNLLADAKQEISDIKSSAVTAKQIIVSIEAYGKRLTEAQAAIDDPATGITANHTKAQEKKNEIETLKTTADAHLAEIKITLDSVQEKIQRMNEAYASFETANTQVTHSETGLVAVHAAATKLKEEIDVLRSSSAEQLDQIKATLATVQTNVKTMSDTYASFLEIKEKIDNPETGLQKILETSEATKQETIAVKKAAEAIYTEIKQFRDDSSGYTKEIEELKKTSEENKNAIVKHEEESRDFKTKIEKIYKIAIDTGLANSFDHRKEELNKSVRRWYRVLIAFTILLFISIVAFLWHIIWNQIDHIDGYTWYRLTLTSPLIFFIAFASVQYNKERSLLEKYAFKAATALSLEGYTTLLINTFGKEKEQNEQEILAFVLMSMSTIYEEPYEQARDSKFSFDINGKFAAVRGNFAKRATQETKNTVGKTMQDAVEKAVEETVTI